MTHHNQATGGPDVLIGGAEHDTIEGRRVDDVVDGGSHSDILQGNPGRDVVLGGSGDDMVRGGAGRDFTRGGSGDDFVNGGGDRDVLHGGSGDDHLLGYDGDDRLFGGAGDDTLRAERGNDVLVGGRGDDMLIGGVDADRFVYFGDVGDDVIYHFELQKDMIDLRLLPEAISFSDLSIVDMAEGSGARITHAALDGSIEIRGVGASELTAANFALPDGTTTSISIDGTTIGANGDVAEGPFLVDRAGGNRIVGGGGGDHVLAGEGNDRVEGGGGDDALFGEEGDDTLAGGTGGDWLFGGEGDDALSGGAGDDRLFGGEGENVFTGGAGDDVFVIGPDSGDERIVDFTDGEDRIDLSHMTGLAGFDDLRIATYGTVTTIELTCTGGGTIWLENTQASEFDALDFVFHEPAALDAM